MIQVDYSDLLPSSLSVSVDVLADIAETKAHSNFEEVSRWDALQAHLILMKEDRNAADQISGEGKYGGLGGNALAVQDPRERDFLVKQGQRFSAVAECLREWADDEDDALMVSGTRCAGNA